MRLGFLLLLSLFSMPAVQAQTVQQWRDSLDILNKQIELHPKSTDLRLRKAAVNIELGQWDYAAEEYSRVLQLDSRNLAAYYFQAYANVCRRQYGQARADYEAVLALAPMHMEARLGLSTVLEKLGRETEARDELNRLVEMFPDSAVCYASRAVFESAHQQTDLALYDWDEAIRLQPVNADFAASKVDLLIHVGRPADARRELNAAVSRGIPYAQLKPWFDQCKP